MLLVVAEWRTRPTTQVLRAVLVLNGYWAGFEDGRFAEATVRLNQAVLSAYREAEVSEPILL